MGNRERFDTQHPGGDTKLMKTRPVFKKQRGYILMAMYLVIALISIFSLAYFTRNNAFIQSAERNRNKLIAFNMAEAGVDKALSTLSQPGHQNWTGTTAYQALDIDHVQGGYTVSVTTPSGHPDVRLIRALGTAPNNTPTSRAYQASSIIAYAQPEAQSFFRYAVFAGNSIKLNGNATVDSYNSNNGAYGDTNTASNGDIGVNSIAPDSVTLVGNATVNGNATVGPSGDPNTVISTSGNASITGTLAAASQPTVNAVPTTTMASSGALNISGNNTTTLGPGTYHYDSIKISGNGQLVFTGPVTIYVGGSVNISGNGIATQNNLPKNFRLYVTTATEVKISGNGDLYAGIYAPTSNIKNTGNGSIFGAVVCETYDQSGNGSIHFDEALRQVPSNQNMKFKITAWQEQKSLTWGTGS